MQNRNSSCLPSGAGCVAVGYLDHLLDEAQLDEEQGVGLAAYGPPNSRAAHSGQNSAASPSSVR